MITLQKPIKPSDARAWLSCHRRVWFDNNPPAEMERVEPNPFDELIIKLGVRHEWSVKRQLEKDNQLVEAVSPEHTKALMVAGVEIIYQPKLIDESLSIVGDPDFLIRTPSGDYQAADAKLARGEEDDDEKKNKKEIQIQLAIYRKLLGSALPALVLHSNGVTSEIGDEANKLADKFLTSMRQILDQPTKPAARYAHSKCSICPYVGICKPEFEAKQELTLVYGITSQNAPHLEAQGITTIRQLADADPEAIADVSYLKGADKKLRAVLQAKSYFTHETHRIGDIQIPGGTWVHFDLEDNPLNDSGEDHVYLWGLLKPPYNWSGFQYAWTDGHEQDQAGWLEFLDILAELKVQYPDLVICHFSHHEVSKIKRYAKRYVMEEHPIVAWLLGENTPLFDIKKPIMEALVLPVMGYGLKPICKNEGLVNFQWSDDESGSQWSVVQYVNYLIEPLKDRREQMKKDILTYNFDDVMATRKLEEWLRKMVVRS